MAESGDLPSVDVGDDIEVTPGYKAPAQKTMIQIMDQDQEDESLMKYKAQLLGTSASESVFWPNDSRCVIVKSLSMVVDGRDDVTLDLTGDLSKLKKEAITIKQGATYRLRINFCVQREIVTGLKLANKVTRKGIKVDSSSYMVGSYGPKQEEQSFTAPPDVAPSGLLARGQYVVASCFVDDDKHKILEWVWSFDIKKEWD